MAEGGNKQSGAPAARMRQPPSPDPRGSSSERAASNVSSMQQMLEQMDRYMQADHSERQKRLQELEARQKELQQLCTQVTATVVSLPEKQKAAATKGLEMEVHSLSARCDKSLRGLVEECKESARELEELRTEKATLQQEISSRDERIKALTNKAEQLARHLVRLLREKTSLEDQLDTTELEAREARLKLESMAVQSRDRDNANAEVSAARKMMMSKQRELDVAVAEITRLNAALERKENDASTARQEMMAQKETVLAEVAQQLAEVVAERDTLSGVNLSLQQANARITEEMRGIARSIRDLEDRLETTQCELLKERATRRELEALAVSGEPPGDGTYQSAKRIAELETKLDETVFRSSESMRQAENRIQSVTRLHDQLSTKCRELETALLTSQTRLTEATKERVAQALIVQRYRSALLSVQSSATQVARSMQTTKLEVSSALVDSPTPSLKLFIEHADHDLEEVSSLLTRLQGLRADEPLPPTTVPPPPPALALQAPSPRASPEPRASKVDRRLVPPVQSPLQADTVHLPAFLPARHSIGAPLISPAGLLP